MPILQPKLNLVGERKFTLERSTSFLHQETLETINGYISPNDIKNNSGVVNKKNHSFCAKFALTIFRPKLNDFGWSAKTEHYFMGMDYLQFLFGEKNTRKDLSIFLPTWCAISCELYNYT